MQVHLDIKEVIMLEVAESIEMKADEYCHDFRPAHSTFPIAVLTPVRPTNGHEGNLFIIITQRAVMKRLKVSIVPRTLCRCLKSVTEHYKQLRDEVRKHNKTLKEGRKTPKVKADTIWHYIVHGKTGSRKLQKIHEAHPKVNHVMKICMDFRKMIHGEEKAQTMDEWLKEAEACPLKEIRSFAKYIRKDRNAVEQPCRTAFNNGLLEGTVNKAKAFKRNMFNKAGPAVLRAKLLYAD